MSTVRDLRNQGGLGEFAAAVKRLSVAQLQDLIDKADSSYYRPGVQPIMTDSEYDLLRPALAALAPDDVRIKRVGVPYAAAELRNKVQHTIPMGSLDNTDDGILGYEPWYDSVATQLGKLPEVCASLKIDGGSVCASYKDGKLVRVASRGNGEVGEDITANAVNFQHLPTVLPQSVDIEVRGEAILFTADFRAICERDLGKPWADIQEGEVSNARNVGNGCFGRDDGRDSEKMQLIAFNVVSNSGLHLPTEAAKFAFLKSLGFQPVPHKICKTVAEFKDFYTSVLDGRGNLPFAIDGVVVCLNEVADQDVFVTADKKSRLRPKYAKAVKFPHYFNTTVLKDVLLTVGHTGAIIPTAVLEEVRVGGVNVTHALLNNWDEINRLGVAIGDVVEVVLSGDIIPKITRCVSKGVQRQIITEPQRCPVCGEPTTRTMRGKPGAVLYCSNDNCPAAALGKIDHWIGTSKKGTGILGIGDTILKALWDNKLVNDAADLYTLTADSMKDVTLDGGGRIGESRAAEIVRNIAAKKCLPLHVFLGSLGIDLLGRRRVEILRKAANGQLDTLADWLDDAKLATIQIPGFGDTIRDSIRTGLQLARPLIDKLLSVGVTIQAEGQDQPKDAVDEPAIADSQVAATPDAGKPFTGITCCWTGTRAYINDFERMGGTVKSGVVKGLHLLVQKDVTSNSNKTIKAEGYGTKIISLSCLKDLIDGNITITDLGIVR